MTRIAQPRKTLFPDDLGECISRDAAAVSHLGWEELFQRRRGRGDFAGLGNLRHPARRLLRQYKFRGAPVVLARKEWTKDHHLAALQRGPHKSALEQTPFLRWDFASMVAKGQWVVLPYSVAIRLPGLRLIPPSVKIERDRRPRWLGDYSFKPINAKTLPICELLAMQYVQYLDRLLCEIVYADLKLEPVHMIKADVSDGFYKIGLRQSDTAKLGLLFPSGAGEEYLVAIPLTLPMGWKNLPPIFCTGTETVADLENEALRAHAPTLPHKMDNRAEAVWVKPAPSLNK